MLRKIKGQSTLEYGLIIAVVVAALLAINLYMKRGVQGKLKESTDQIGKQFEPGTASSSWETASTGTTTTTETRAAGTTGGITSNITSTEEIERSEHEAWGTASQYYTQ